MSIRVRAQTLIEVLITLLFLALSVLALIRLQNLLLYDNILAQQKADAITLGMSQLETLQDYHVLNNTTGYTSYQSIASGTNTVTGKTATYTLTWTVTSFTNPTYKTINLTVAWTDRAGSAQTLQLVTHVAGIEPANSSAIM